jgi:glycosyltransferase involved in cell wall biosynthesis
MGSRPLKVVHLITELNMGGAEHMLYKVVTRMNRKRFRCRVVSMTDMGTIGRKIEAEGIPVFHLGMNLGRPTPGALWTLFLLIKRERADLLQTWLYHADLMGMIAGRIASVPKVLWGVRCSDMDLRNYRMLTTLTVRLCAFLSPLADAIVVNSEEGRRVHRRLGYHSKNMIVIPNGFDTRIFRPDPLARDRLLAELGLPQEAVLIGLVARYDPMKDHGTFLKAASLLVSRSRRAHFVLVGRGMDPRNPDLSKYADARLEGRVHFLGPRDDMPWLTAALDVATNSSAYGEGFSNTIGEAMACGIPCVVTDVGDAARIVGDAGIVIPPGDPEAMAGVWQQLLEMGGDRRRLMGERARGRILKEFSIDRVVNRFEELYEGLFFHAGGGGRQAISQ